jgi:hypothetical protein
VRVTFEALRDGLARINYDQRGGIARNVEIRINSRVRWSTKLCLREVAHELAHLLRPQMDHGERFERVIVKVKAVMERDPSWY